MPWLTLLYPTCILSYPRVSTLSKHGDPMLPLFSGTWTMSHTCCGTRAVPETPPLMHSLDAVLCACRQLAEKLICSAVGSCSDSAFLHCVHQFASSFLPTLSSLSRGYAPPDTSPPFKWKGKCVPPAAAGHLLVCSVLHRHPAPCSPSRSLSSGFQCPTQPPHTPHPSRHRPPCTRCSRDMPPWPEPPPPTPC